MLRLHMANDSSHPSTTAVADPPESGPIRPDLQVIHATIAAVALGLQPLSAAMASIGQVALIAMAVVRWIADPAARADPRAALRRPVVSLGLLLVVWTLLAVVWSPDPGEGLAGLRPIRAVLFASALLPAIRGSNRPLVGLTIGVAVACAVQTLMFVGVVPDPNYDPWTVSGGLSKHPGNAAAWSGCAALLAAGWLASAPECPSLGRRAWLVVAIVTGVASVVIAGNRSLYLGLPIAVLVLGVSIAVTGTTRVRRIVVTAGLLGVVGLAAVPVIVPDLGVIDRLRSLTREVGEGMEASTAADADTSGGLRMLWWREAVPIVADAPIVGHGSGATRQAYADHLATLDPEAIPARAYTDNPHSTIVFELVEHGAVGGLLLAGFGMALVVTGWRTSTRVAGAAGLPAAMVIFVAYAIGNTVQLSPYPLMLLATLTAFSLVAPPRIRVTSAT